jgi:RNA polymerase sigma-70 factor (ECF subfamily)
MHASNEELFARYQRTQDPAWLEQVVCATLAPLLRHARALGLTPHDAADVAQAAYATALGAAGSFDARRCLLAWLRGIMTNKVRALGRARARRPDLQELGDEAVDDDPLCHATTAEAKRLVGEVVARLPDPYRAALKLRYQDGLDYAEIASRLNKAPGTVRTHVARGLLRLRRALPRGLDPTAALLLALALAAALRPPAAAPGF